jgi:hypothetical protein
MISAVEHAGVSIVQADLRGVAPEDYVRRLEEASVEIAAHPARPVRLLVYSSGMPCPFASANAMKAFLLRNRAHVVATAVVGLSPVKRSVVAALALTTKARTRNFDDRAAALGWLAEA